MSTTDSIALDPIAEQQARKRTRRLLGELVRPVKWPLIGITVMVVIAMFANSVGPSILAWSIDTALPAVLAGDATAAIWAGVAYAAAGLIAGVFTFGYVRGSAVIGQRLLFVLRRRLFRHTQGLSLEFHERSNSGRVIARQTSDMDALRELVDSGVTGFVDSLLMTVFTFILIAALDWVSALILLVMLVPAWWLARWFIRTSRLAYRDMRTHSARLIGDFVETFTGIRAVQAFRREAENDAHYDVLATDYADATMRSIRVFGVFQPSLKLLGNVVVAVLLLVGGLRVLAGDLQVGVLLALVLYGRNFFRPIDEVAMLTNSMQSALSALEKIAGLLAEEPKVAEPEVATPLPAGHGELDFDDVTMQYTSGGPLVIDHLDLHVPAGQQLALVGRTGAGKSTLAKLMARFYDPVSGGVRLDGVDLRALANEELTRSVVMVTQESFLFSGTIRDNIALGRPDATDAEVRAAAAAIGADAFIEQLPEGYDTDVRSRGGRLSAGQRQLVSFARAFLANPRVLILDEATSSLDLPSERAVQEGLETLLGNRTAVIIAHRLTTVLGADRVLVVDDGRVIEDGTPAELIAAGGSFAGLYEAWQATR